MDKFLDWLYSKRVVLLWVCLSTVLLCVLLTAWHFWPTFRATVELLDFKTFLPLVACNSKPPMPTPTPIPDPKGGVGFHHPYGTLGANQFQNFVVGHDWHYDPNKPDGYLMASMIWGASVYGKLPTPTHYVDRKPVLMGFNEPDMPSQSNLTPEEAAVLWLQMESYYRGYYMVSPAPSQMDVDWLRRWRQAFRDLTGRDPKVDAIAAHCYSTTARCQDILQESRRVAEEFGGLPVWVTEFACLPLGADDIPRQTQNLALLLQWMDDQEWIAYWFYFIMSSSGDESWSFGHDLNPSLVNFHTGKITPFGQVFTGEYVAPMVDYVTPKEKVPLEEILRSRSTMVSIPMPIPAPTTTPTTEPTTTPTIEPTATPIPEHFTFVVYGDNVMATNSCTSGIPQRLRIVDLIDRLNPDFVVHTGDIVDHAYEYGAYNHFEVCNEPWLRDTPFYPTSGNHDQANGGIRKYHDWLLSVVGANIEKGAPDVEIGSDTWYSFQWGNSKFLSFEQGTHWWTRTPPAWVEQELAKAQADSSIDHIFVTMHHPMYSTIMKQKGIIFVRQKYEALFRKYKVTAVFSGHVHAFEDIQAHGVRYIVTGGGGGPLNKCANSGNRVCGTYHVTLVTVEGKNVHIERRGV